MGEILQLDYYYGIEAEQFSFYRVPRLLIKDERFKKLSSDAKLLYGLMLDRMSLSIKNEWFDEDNRAYIIYTIDSIMEDLGCGKEKAVKVLAELDSVILWRTNACWNNGGAIVFCHFLIYGIDPWIIPAFIIMIHSSATVVRHEDLCNTAKVRVHVDVCCNP